jgi:hypothetical protein
MPSSFTRSRVYQGHRLFHLRLTCRTRWQRTQRLPRSVPRFKGIRPEEFADRTSFFRFGRDPRSFDILPDLPGVDFEDAWERRVEGVLDAATGLKAFFISKDDLIAAKLASGRPQDLADADAIQKATENKTP